MIDFYTVDELDPSPTDRFVSLRGLVLKHGSLALSQRIPAALGNAGVQQVLLALSHFHYPGVARPARPARGTFTAPDPQDLTDESQFEIGEGTFEVDEADDGVSGGAIPLVTDGLTTNVQVAAALVAAINANSADIGVIAFHDDPTTAVVRVVACSMNPRVSPSGYFGIVLDGASLNGTPIIDDPDEPTEWPEVTWEGGRDPVQGVFAMPVVYGARRAIAWGTFLKADDLLFTPPGPA